MKKNIILLSIILSIFSLFAQEQKISSRLQDILLTSEENDYIRTMVILEEQVDVAAMDVQFYREKASIERRSTEVISALKSNSLRTQKNLLLYLRDKEETGEIFRHQSFWIVNMVIVEAKPSVIYEMATMSEVDMVDHDGLLQRDLPVDVLEEVPGDGLESVEPGVKIINADKLWELGITGAGRIVMGIDTGVDVTHPALNFKWRGNHVPASQAWFDPNTGSPAPTDCDGHGTHTMGTMTGWTTSDTVGVAPDAEWIAAKTICSSPHTSNSIAAFQWAMDPDGNPATIDDMPDAISNSWYDPNIGNECNSIYKTTFDAVEAVGIAVVFSAGNSGPGTQTITTPKNINTDEVNVWATGAISGSSYLAGSNTPIASFSSRGPSYCGGTGSLLIKPEACAPGVSVRSSVPGGGYGLLSGTSMAAPHVAGAIALLRQFAPQLTGKQVKMALYNTAKDLGDPGEDNVYGMGLIDVYEAFLSLGTPDDTPPEPVSDLQVIDPTSNSLTLTWTVPYDSSQNGVTQYDLRYSTTMIIDSNDFNNATPLEFPGQPKDYGETETFTHDALGFTSTLYYALRSKDIWGNVSDLSNIEVGTTYDQPEINVDPLTLSLELEPNEEKKDTFYISNVTSYNSTLDYSLQMTNNTFPEERAASLRIIPQIRLNEDSGLGSKDKPEEFNGMAIEGSGGPDLFGYKWIDSNEPNGPEYTWEDISTTGTMVSTWTPTGSFSGTDEGYAGPFNLGFDFNYYGNPKTEVYFSSNGFVTFGPISGNTFTNDEIPNSDTPNEIIAPLWDDLDGKTTGKVYYKQDGNRFIVQYDSWPRYSGGGDFTFQVILHSNGRIMFYYEDMNGSVTSSTVGIENNDGTDGLQVAYNSSYVVNQLALQFAADPDWLSGSHSSGLLYNGNSAMVELTFASEDYPAGNYSMDVIVTSNDPVNPEITVSVNMTINDGSVPVELSSFAANPVGGGVEITWSTATETNNQGFEVERRMGNIQSWESIGFVEGKGNSTNLNRYQFVDNLSDLNYSGKINYRLKQIDLDGSYDYFGSIEVEVDLKPKEYSLAQNYPNPFNPATTIKYALPEASEIKIVIYNMIGQKIADLFSGIQESGYYEINWNAADLASGIYVYMLEATAAGSSQQFRDFKKMVLMK